MNFQEIQNKSEEFVGKIEGGDRSPLTDELNNMSFQDRLAVAREMDRLNVQHRKTNGSLPDIQISFAGASGNEQLIDMSVRENSRTTDLYDYKVTSLRDGDPGSMQFGRTDSGRQVWKFKDGSMVVEDGNDRLDSKSRLVQQQWDKAKDLLAKLYSGNTDAVTADLNGLSEEDRPAVAKAMDRLNADDRRKNRNLPDVQVSTAGYSGREQLVNINIKDGAKRTDIYRYRAR